MKVGIIGFGYIGAVCTAGLVDQVEEVIILDTDLSRTRHVEQKTFQFPEEDVAEIINRSSITVASDIKDVVSASLIMVCVNTPLRSDGSLDDSVIRKVISDLRSLSYKGNIVIRSTLPFCDNIFKFFEAQELKIFVVPEFLREGSALKDFRDGEVLVIGKPITADESSVKSVKSVLEKFFRETIEMDLRSAVYLKLLNNTWHATKVAFANEWKRLAQELGVEEVGEIHSAFIGDEKLNLSAKYLRPGGPFGGPCLTKDIAEFNGLAAGRIQEITKAVVESNAMFVSELSLKIIDICDNSCRTFSFDTLEFKAGTGDERHSPIIGVIKCVEENSTLRFESDPLHADCVFSGRRLLDQGLVEKIAK